MKTKDLNLQGRDQKVWDLDNDSIIISPNISSKNFYTSAGSKMLENYRSMFDASLVEEINENLLAQSTMPEFGIGPGDYNIGSAVDRTGSLGIMTDSSGELAKEAKENEIYGLSLSYGLVSRYGIIPVSSSIDTVAILSNDIASIRKILNKITIKDDKDSASIGSQGEDYTDVKSLDEPIVDIEDLDLDMDLNISTYEIISSGEFATSMEKYDGIAYGYRTDDYEDVEDIYKNSRTEALSQEVRNKIVFGNFVLLEENYETYYDQALRARTYIKEVFDQALDLNEFISCPCDRIYSAGARLAGLPYLYLPESDRILITRAFNEKSLLDRVEER